jgi:AAA+ superfamily predicted ATPase
MIRPPVGRARVVGDDGVVDELITSLTRAVQANPDDLPLRLHLADLLASAGRRGEAIAHCAAALQLAPADPAAATLMSRLLGTAEPPSAPDDAPILDQSGTARAPGRPGSAPGALVDGPAVGETPHPSGFDWRAAETELGGIAQPMFVDGQVRPEVSAWDVEDATITLADVGGLTEVKERLEVSFLAPLRNPQMRRMYGKSLRGGLLLYGPPGCGKTFVARAVAGEMGAKFISVGLSDILDMWVGNSEKNIHELFTLARAQAPVVLFLDEIDALGQKRSQTRQSAMRGSVNQLLTELDGVDGANEGVFVLAATNQPWDVDPALRRPGRLDRTLLVLPPDAAAREAILRHHLKSRPVEGIDLSRLARLSDGYSGADLAYLCEAAAERAMMHGVRTGTVRMIQMADLESAIREIRPSVGSWFDLARNVVLFADSDGTYAELRHYMKRTRRL